MRATLCWKISEMAKAGDLINAMGEGVEEKASTDKNYGKVDVEAVKGTNISGGDESDDESVGMAEV